ncbi:calcium/proton exchanger [Solirubrobacter phytolaccae]|uniref:Ca(2+)/H(+) antiporter n=1 Tax=Solirubrobacter phytolaccae TaxID=1404360 RepID=A0A9X3NCI3_9ACTN|nr:calcium/proton exchanger [Solirubrobacter phytolaccae]MDA0182589.1 calcium/proton exchanger [Solirubrobacter phytolaccae]
MTSAAQPFNLRRFLFSGSGWPYLLLPFIVIAVVLDLLEADPILVFFASALGVVPTAALMGRATEELAHRAGPGIGGLLNVTFGNAPELIIALFALEKGLQEVVKASIIGSILGNLLLVMGAAFLIGGWGRERNKFVAEAASAQATMLLLAVVALVLPAMFLIAQGGELPKLGEEATNFPASVEHMSFAVAIVLLISYFAGLWFSLKTHHDVFNPDSEDDTPEDAWSVKRSVGMLAGAGVAVGVMSEILVGSIEEASKGIGLSPFFVSLIIVAIVGNAAEHWVAVYFAARNKMDIAIGIAIGSSAQIALFVMPVLVLLSFVLGPFPLALEFSSIEIGAVLLAVLIAAHVSQDGESTWFEGVQLLAVYVVLGIVFYFV